MSAEPSKAGLRWPLKGLETDGWPRSHQGDPQSGFPYLGKRERLLLSGVSGLYSSHLPTPGLTVAQIRRNSGAWESEEAVLPAEGLGPCGRTPAFPIVCSLSRSGVPGEGCGFLPATATEAARTVQRDCTTVWPSLISGNVCFLINMKVDLHDWRTSTTCLLWMLILFIPPIFRSRWDFLQK